MVNVEQKVDEYFGLIKQTLDNLGRSKMAQFADMLIETYDNKGTTYIFGNGGSAANATHFCGDFIKGVSHGLKDDRFKMQCLSDNLPAMMAIANDISYDDVFVEQIKNFLKPGDLAIGISGSGNSMNVIKALEYANNHGAKTVAFCGYNGGKIKNIATLALHAELNNMEVAEDIHSIIGHCTKNIVIDILKEKGRYEK